MREELAMKFEKTFIHYRLYKKGESTPLSRGGLTVCLLEADGKLVVGSTICSIKDNYQKSTGRHVSEAAARGAEVGHADTLKVSEFEFNRDLPLVDRMVQPVFQAKVQKWVEAKRLKAMRFEGTDKKELAKQFSDWLNSRALFRVGKEKVDLRELTLKPSGRKVKA